MKPLLLVAGLFVSLLIAVVVVIQLVRVPQIIAVKGYASLEILPDTATVTIGYFKIAPTSQEATLSVAEGMGKILAAVKAAGIKDDAITGEELTASPVTVRSEKTNEDVLKGFRAHQTVVVRVTDFSKLGKLLVTISNAGSNNWNLSYEIPDYKKYSAELQKAALADATAKADNYAANGGFKRGKLLKVNEASLSFPEVNYWKRGYESETVDSVSVGNQIETVIVTAERRSQPATDSFDIPAPAKETVSTEISTLFELD